jgi:hypothetical protein
MDEPSASHAAQVSGVLGHARDGNQAAVNLPASTNEPARAIIGNICCDAPVIELEITPCI